VIDPAAILADVRANIAKLHGCEHHDFHGIPERAMPCKDGLLYRDYRCSRCGGKVSASDYRWYQRGLEHGAKTGEVTP
jgi:hypothetical protein